MIEISAYSQDQVALSFPYCEYFIDGIKNTVPKEHRWYNRNTHSWIIGIEYLADVVNALEPCNFSAKDSLIRNYLHEDADAEAEREAVHKRLEGITPIRPTNDLGLKTKALPHQIEGFNVGITSPKLLIGDEQGLGKTKTALSIAVYRKHNQLIRKCLIVCCVNSTKYNWQAEIAKHTSENSVMFDQTSPEKKLEAIRQWESDPNTLFGIINIEALRPKKVEKYKVKQLLKGIIDPSRLPMNPLMAELIGAAQMVIVDEVHKCKSPTSLQGVALRQLQMPYRLALSGTPMTNTVTDLWNIMKWLGAMKMNFWDFRSTYCILGGFENRQVVGCRNMKSLNAALNEVMLRRHKADVLDLPPKTHEVEFVELTPVERKRYAEAEDGILKRFIGPDGKVKAENASSALTTILRLRQVTDGLNIDTGEAVDEKDNAKLKRITELLEEDIIANGKKALLFSSWESVTAIYRNALAQYEPAYIVGEIPPDERQKEVDRFQTDPDCKIAIGTIGAMGTGLTMTAAEYVIFIDKDWAAANNDQAEDRSYRIGTTKNVTVISVTAKNSIDERVENALAAKREAFAAAVDGASSVSSGGGGTSEQTIAYLLGMSDTF